MTIDKESFKNLEISFTFTNSGDKYERDYGELVTKEFPNCQRLWQLMVVPMTKRMEGSDNIDIRDQKFDENLLELRSIHYSLFLNLACAHKHIQEKDELCGLEDTFAHLGSACDLTEEFLEKWYLFRLTKLENKENPNFEKLT